MKFEFGYVYHTHVTNKIITLALDRACRRNETKNSLLVETSLSGNTWTTLGLWTASEREQQEEGVAEYSARVTAAEGVTNIARCGWPSCCERFVCFVFVPSILAPVTPSPLVLFEVSAGATQEEAGYGMRCPNTI